MEMERLHPGKKLIELKILISLIFRKSVDTENSHQSKKNYYIILGNVLIFVFKIYFHFTLLTLRAKSFSYFLRITIFGTIYNTAKQFNICL